MDKEIVFELDGGQDILNLEVKETTKIAYVREKLKEKCAPKLDQFAAVELKLSLITDGNVVELNPTALHTVIPDGSTVVIHHPEYKKEVTWAELADEPLPEAPKGIYSVTTSKRVAPDRHYPLLLTRWDSFTDNALSFQFPEQKPGFQDIRGGGSVNAEPKVWSLLDFNVGHFFAQSALGSIEMCPGSRTKRTASAEHKSASMLIGKPDLVALNADKKFIGIIEGKVPWGVDLKDLEGTGTGPWPELTFVGRYNSKVGDATGGHTWSAIAQTVGYMLDNKFRYGALSTYNETRFFHALSADKIEVSDVVLASSATGPGVVSLRRAFAYWLSLCNEPPDGKLPVATGFKRRHTAEWKELTTPGQPSASSSSLDSTTMKANDSARAPDINSIATVRLSSVLGHSKYVDWSDLEFIESVGGGRCGEVMLVLWQGRRIALKLFDVCKQGFEGFDRELQAHTSLFPCHVKVAKLQFVTLSPSGQVYGIGSWFGQPMPKLEMWSDIQRRSAFEALQSLAEVGMAQRDVCDRNFVSNTSGDLLVIDLEDVTPLESGEIDQYLASSRSYLFS